MNIPSNGLYFFVGQLHAETKNLSELLKQKNNYCFKSDAFDEIDQAARQQGKAALIFSDPKFALEFLKKNRWPDLKLKFYLLIDKNGFFKPETMTIFSQLNLNVFFPNTMEDMLKSFESYFSSIAELEDEIEFDILKKVK